MVYYLPQLRVLLCGLLQRDANDVFYFSLTRMPSVKTFYIFSKSIHLRKNIDVQICKILRINRRQIFLEEDNFMSWKFENITYIFYGNGANPTFWTTLTNLGVKNQRLYCRENQEMSLLFSLGSCYYSRGEKQKKKLNIKHNISSERSQRVRYCSCHENIKFTSSRHHVISSIYNEASLLIKIDKNHYINTLY